MTDSHPPVDRWARPKPNGSHTEPVARHAQGRTKTSGDTPTKNPIGNAGTPSVQGSRGTFAPDPKGVSSQETPRDFRPAQKGVGRGIGNQEVPASKRTSRDTPREPSQTGRVV